MPVNFHMPLGLAAKLALAALTLTACAAPATPLPTAAPTQPPTATALPPTAAATAQSTAAAADLPVQATAIQLSGPSDVIFDAENNIYVSEDSKGRIYKIGPFGQLITYAGTGGFSFSGDGGPARNADLGGAESLAFDHDGNLFVSDTANHRIRRIDRNGIISTVAGSGPTGVSGGGGGDFGGDGGPATSARLNRPSGIAFDRAGNLYIADLGNNRIRKLDTNGIMTTFAGNGTAGFSGDGGPANMAELHLNAGSWSFIAFDAQGQLYIADGGNNRVRKVDQQGAISTIAGTGEPAVSGDGGPATAAALSSPAGLAFDASGNLYIACDQSSFASDARIRKVDGRGNITTIVGTGALGFSGDGGPATAALLNGPAGIAFDPQGNLYIADAGNSRVRKVDMYGIITTVAGGHF